jgi:RND family efflux transporter MFP subunit
MNKTRYSSLVFVILAVLFISPTYGAEYDADIQFAHRVTLSVPVSGEISQVNVEPGKQINSGDILLTLNKTPFEASMRQAKANVSKYNAIQKEANRDLELLTELYDRGVLSKIDLENGQLKLQRAKADSDVAHANLTKATYNLDRASIMAPFDGWVINVKVNNYESVNNVVKVMPLITVVENGRYIARTQAPLSAVNKLKIGNKTKVIIGNQSFSGKVAAIALEPIKSDKGKKSYEVKIEFNNKKKLLRAGESARVLF